MHIVTQMVMLITCAVSEMFVGTVCTFLNSRLC